MVDRGFRHDDVGVDRGEEAAELGHVVEVLVPRDVGGFLMPLEELEAGDEFFGVVDAVGGVFGGVVVAGVDGGGCGDLRGDAHGFSVPLGVAGASAPFRVLPGTGGTAQTSL